MISISKGNTEYKVLEIFTSFQGEGHNLGKHVTFVRLSGCNLDCPWCDEKAGKTSQRQFYSMEASDIIRYIKANTVIITGGEPTLQNVEELAFEIHRVYPFTSVCVETNGTNPLGHDEIDWISCSPKAENNYMIADGLEYDELKYVVDDDFKASVVPVTKKTVWLQPENFTFAESIKKAEEILHRDGQDNWRLGIQAHKFWEVK